MKKLLLFCTFSIITINAEVIVRHMEQQDIVGVIELDRKVTNEFFLPVLTKAYDKLGVNTSTHEFLEQDLEEDIKKFNSVADLQATEKILIAIDKLSNTYIGLLMYHLKEDGSTLELDLLLVDQSYRRCGIGKKLILTSLCTFKDIKRCVVNPLKYCNDATLKFYERLGFKNLGNCKINKANRSGIKYCDLYYDFELIL